MRMILGRQNHLMKNDKEVPALIEIIFENRNKQYGAYILRTHYNSYLVRSLGIALLTLGLLIFIFHFTQSRHEEVHSVKLLDSIVFTSGSEIIQKQPLSSNHFAPPKNNNAADPHSFIPVDTTDKEKTTDTTNDHPFNNPIGKNDSDFDASASLNAPGIDVNLHANDTLSGGMVDQLPEYPGGMDEFTGFIRNNLKYTPEAIEAQLKMKVYVRFVINKEGFISDVRILNKIGFGMEEKILNTLKKSKPWLPGLMKNNPVNTEMILPLSFSLL
jgi:protein TonB